MLKSLEVCPSCLSRSQSSVSGLVAALPGALTLSPLGLSSSRSSPLLPLVLTLSLGWEPSPALTWELFPLIHLHRTFPNSILFTGAGAEVGRILGATIQPMTPPKAHLPPKGKNHPSNKGQTPLECSQIRGSHYLTFEKCHPIPLNCPREPWAPLDSITPQLPSFCSGTPVPWQVGVVQKLQVRGGTRLPLKREGGQLGEAG